MDWPQALKGPASGARADETLLLIFTHVSTIAEYPSRSFFSPH